MYKNYNMNQVILPLDFEMKLAEKDIAFSLLSIKRQVVLLITLK